MSEALARFYKKRESELLSKPAMGGSGVLYTYDEEGNLVTKDKTGAIKGTLVIPSYHPVSLEERDIMEQERKDRIAEATRAYDEAFQAVHDEYMRKDRSAEQILQKMRRMVQADHHLQHMRFPLQYVEKEKGVEIRRLDFKQPHEIRKLPYPIAIRRVSPFPLQEMYVREGDGKEEKEEKAAPLRSVGSLPVSKLSAVAAEKGVLFVEDADTNENGFMAMDWPVQIRLQSMVYHCAKQALAAEQAKAFGDDEGFRRIMDARTPAEVSYRREDAKKATEEDWAMTTRAKLYEIQEAKFRQYPELQSRLLSTGEAILAAYLPQDALLGIGISTDDLRAKNPIHWRGQNLLGTALMELRERFRVEQEKRAAEEELVVASPPARSIRTRRPRVASSAAAPPAASVALPLSAPVGPAALPLSAPVGLIPARSLKAPSAPAPAPEQAP
jgi:ribA/ribD-fused uncharacterized protein